MTRHRIRFFLKRGSVLAVFVAMFWSLAMLTREPAEGDLRLGQRAYVDDGTCPQGQVKEITGSKLTPAGLQRTRKCVARSGIH